MAAGCGGADTDRLSELPDGVLQEILALLPLRDLVRTAVLSRKWRHLWPTTPVLDLSSVPEPLRVDSYYPVLRRCLGVHGALRRLSVIIDESYPDSSSLADICAAFAQLRSVHDLFLTGCYVRAPYPTIFTAAPQSLFLCRSLRYLFLSNFTFGSVPASALFPFLSDVVITDACLFAEDAAALLAACPCIESFSIMGCEPLGCLVINSPTLRCLQLLERPCRPAFAALKIHHAPVLRSLALRCDLKRIEPFKDFEELLDVTAFIQPSESFENRQQWLKFIQGIEYTRCLSVNHWFLQFITSEIGFWGAPMLDIEEFHLCSELFTMANLLSLLLFLKDCTPMQFYLHVRPQPLHFFHFQYPMSLLRMLMACMRILQRDHPAGRCDNSILKCDDLSEDDFWKFIEKHCDIWKRDKSDDVEEESEVDSDDPRYDDLHEGNMLVLEKIVITGFSGKEEEMLLVKFVMEYAKYLRFVFLYYGEGIGEERLEEISKEVQSFHRVSSDLQVSISELPLNSVCLTHDSWWNMYVLDD